MSSSKNRKQPETILDLFTSINFTRYGKLYLTDEQAYNLSQKQWKDGKFFFNYSIDDEYRSAQNEKMFIYNILSMYLNNEVDEIDITKLEKSQILKNNIFEKLNNHIDKLIHWFDKKQDESYVIYIIGNFFDDEKSNFLVNIEKSKGIVTQSEGLYPCKKCSSFKTISISFQMRSGDEGTSALCSCKNCGNKWTEHG